MRGDGAAQGKVEGEAQEWQRYLQPEHGAAAGRGEGEARGSCEGGEGVAQRERYLQPEHGAAAHPHKRHFLATLRMAHTPHRRQQRQPRRLMFVLRVLQRKRAWKKRGWRAWISAIHRWLGAFPGRANT